MWSSMAIRHEEEELCEMSSLWNPITCTRRFKKVYNKTAYFTVMTACEGYQVMRSVVVRCTMKVGSPAVYDWAEVMQRWIAADGTYVNFARLRQTFNTMYFDLWLFRTALILRQWNAIYDRVYSGTVCPYMSIIPELRRRGLKGVYIVIFHLALL